MTTSRRRDRGGRDDNQGNSGMQERVVDIKRVSKVVKGGRHFSFNAMVVVGDGSGRVGIGLGKAGEAPEAVRKGTTIARRNLIQVPLKGGTIPHEITFSYGASRVMLKPAAPGTGIIAGGSVRAVVTAVGVKDILTKSLGNPNPVNLVKATYYGLAKMKSPEEAVTARKALAAALQAAPPPEPRSPRPPRPNRPLPRPAPRDGRPEGAAAPAAASSASPVAVATVPSAPQAEAAPNE